MLSDKIFIDKNSLYQARLYTTK